MDETYQGRRPNPGNVEADKMEVDMVDMYDGHWYRINNPDPSRGRHHRVISQTTRRHSDPERYIIYDGKYEKSIVLNDSTDQSGKDHNDGVAASDSSITNTTPEFYYGTTHLTSNDRRIENKSNRIKTRDGYETGDPRARSKHRRRYSDPHVPTRGEHTFIESTKDGGKIRLPDKDYPTYESRTSGHEYLPVDAVQPPWDHTNGLDDIVTEFGNEMYVSDHGYWLERQPDTTDMVIPDRTMYVYRGRPESNDGHLPQLDNRKYRFQHQPEYKHAHTDFPDKVDRQNYPHVNGHASNSRESRSGHHRTHPSKGRDENTGCHQFLRYATTLFTFIVFIAGAGLLGLGIYLLGSDYGAQEMSSVLGNSLYQVVTYVLIISGAFIVLISMCGCCGALRESKFMLIIFATLVSIIVLALIAAVAIVFVFRSKLEDNIVHSMRDVVMKKYGVDLQNHTNNRMVTDTMNWLQRELKCCGVNGGINSTTSWSIYKYSDWYKGFETGKPYVPQSCCVQDGDLNICTGINAINGPPSKGPPLQSDMENNEYLYTTGCYDEIINYIQSHLIMIGVASIGTIVVMLFGLFFSIYLCRRIDIDQY